MDRRRPRLTPARALLVAAALGATAAPAAEAAPIYVLTGRGFGHGIGMSQYGAEGMAQAGFGLGSILGRYYPGTTLDAAPPARIRVLLGAPRVLTATLPSGGAVLVDTGVSIPAEGVVTAQTTDGGVTVRDTQGAVLAVAPSVRLMGPAPLLAGPPPTQPTSQARTTSALLDDDLYRGDLVLRAAGPAVQVVNDVPLDDYVRGVVPRESPSYWRPAALQAQAVAARTYALAARRSTGDFDVYPDQRSQVYGGVGAETDSTDAAVGATAGRILTYGGRVASTYFYSSSGGRTAAVQDVWGGTPIDYLRSVPDPEDRISPYYSWLPRAYAAPQLGRALGIGPVARVELAVNQSLRVDTASITARDGRRVVLSGSDVRTRLGLRSSWFRFRRVDLRSVQRRGARVTALAVVDPGPAATLLGRAPRGKWQTLGRGRPDAKGRLVIRARAPGLTVFRLRVSGVLTPLVRARGR